MKNVFVVCDCKGGYAILATPSASKAYKLLEKGRRIEIWDRSIKIKVVHNKTRNLMDEYLEIERLYHMKKQNRAEIKNKRRKPNGN